MICCICSDIRYCRNILDLDVSSLVANKVIDFYYMFVFETPLVADMGHILDNFIRLATTLNIDKFETYLVNDMSYMFNQSKNWIQ